MTCRRRSQATLVSQSGGLRNGRSRIGMITGSTCNVMSKDLVSDSKFLSLVLRHKPETVGVALDENGWIDVSELLTACAKHGRAISRERLDRIVETNDKKRFAFSEDGRRI